jgi:hypothetical protein
VHPEQGAGGGDDREHEPADGRGRHEHRERPGLTRRSAVDQVAAMWAAEIFEELTGPQSGWSPDAYEDWLTERLEAMLLPPGGSAAAPA